MSAPTASPHVAWRGYLRTGLFLTTLATIVALALLASGQRGSIGLGPISISLNDFRRPLIAGGLAATWLLATEWRRPRWRRFAAMALALLGLFGIAAFARDVPPIITDSDLAVGELYTQLATRGQLLVGPYSRFGWHHPGPLYFYVVAPFYALSDHRAAALYAASVAINLAALITLGWTVARDGQRRLLAVTLASACLLFAWRVPMLLASPWTAHVPVLPSLTLVVVAAAVAGGGITLWPLLVLFGSFIAQTHVGFVPLVGVIAFGTLAMNIRDRRQDKRRLRAVLNRSAWTCALLWLLPISEALSNTGGNPAALWRFFVADNAPVHSAREALITWSYGMTSVLRPGFELPWGGHIAMSGLWWAVPLAAGQLLLLAAITRADLRAGRRFEGCLALMALAASVVGFWGLTRVRDDILNHDLFRIAALGTLDLAIIVATALRLTAAPRWMEHRGVAAVAVLIVSGSALILGARDLDALTSYERRRTERAAIVAAYSSIRDYIRTEGVRKPLLVVRSDKWSEAAGMLLRMQQAGMPVAVSAGSMSIFADAFAASGEEDVEITVADVDLHETLRTRPGSASLFESHVVTVDAMRIPPASRR